jgi:predicted Zn-dependent peptidase
MASVYHKKVLTNGLTILGETNSSNVSCAIGYFVRTGARDETTVESGLSHFLEHMMFKGTPTRSALDINLELGNLGAQANAFTSEENTVYYASVIPERFSAMQELLSDMLRPSLDPSEFDMEKKVILEEIALYQDRPHFFLFESALKDYFGNHSAGNSVLGSHGSVSELTQPQMLDYFRRRYTPSNTVLCGTGNFNWDNFVADAERLTASWGDAPVGRRLSRHEGKIESKIYRKRNLNQTHAFLVTEGPGAQDMERYPLAILATIMGDSSGSRMYWDLIDRGLAESASVDSDERDGCGCFTAYVSTTADKLDEVVGIAKDILASPKSFSDGDLDRAKAKVISRIVLDGELPMGRLMALGMEWQYRRESTPLRTIIERVQSISRSDIEGALERFPLVRWAEYRLLPE